MNKTERMLSRTHAGAQSSAYGKNFVGEAEHNFPE